MRHLSVTLLAPLLAHVAVAAPNATLLKYLTTIADFVVNIDVGSNNLSCSPACGPPSHIFINGNLARILLAAHKISPNPLYLKEGLRWCDSFVALQIPITTSTGEAAGVWDTGYNETFIADTGTALVTLAGCHELQTDAVKAAGYLDALVKYSKFVRYGCVTPPPIGSGKISGVCPPSGSGWIASNGGVGDGWYQGRLNLEPYTISTATTGSCGFVEMEDCGVASGPDLKKIALGAVQWLVANRTSDGRIPYTIFPPDPSHTVYQPISYSAESFIDVDLRYPEALPLVSPLKTTCDWLASNQTKDGAFRGSWGSFTSTEQGRFGFSASGDAQRSPRALSLLQWCSLRLSPPTPAHAAAAEAFVEFVQRPDAASAFGINALVLPTGFVGLALADYVQPWSTFRSRRSH